VFSFYNLLQPETSIGNKLCKYNVEKFRSEERLMFGLVSPLKTSCTHNIFTFIQGREAKDLNLSNNKNKGTGYTFNQPDCELLCSTEFLLSKLCFVSDLHFYNCCRFRSAFTITFLFLSSYCTVVVDFFVIYYDLTINCKYILRLQYFLNYFEGLGK
jgi:hypothetical protein